MGKAIEGAAFLAGAVGMGVAASIDPALIASPLFDKAWAMMIATGVSMEAGAIASALTGNRGMGITVRQAAGARQVIWGQQRVGGVEIYRSTTGSSHDQFNYVIVITGHEVYNLVNLYLDGRQVHWQGSGAGYSVRNGVGFGGIADGNSYEGPNGVQYNFGGTGHSGIYCEARYGDQLDGDVIGGLTANDGNWAANSSGSPWVAGCTYVYLKIEYNSSLFPTEPEIRFTVNGKNGIYDPRTGTTGFTSNWALCAADVITDLVFGLGDDSVNQEQLIAAANVCDEQVQCAAGMEARYTTNYHTDTTASPGDILDAMMTGACGRLSQINGEWFLWPAYYQGPSFTFDENSLTGTPQWNSYRSKRDLINRVNGTYIAPTFPYNVAGNLYDANGFYNGQTQNNFPFAWQPTSYPQYACDVLHGFANDQYLTADGTQLPKELGFQTVISVSQAQRVAKLYLKKNRRQGSGTFQMNLSAWRMQPCDVMQFTFADLGMSEQLLEVTGSTFHIVEGDDGVQTIGCAMQVQETDPSDYEWSPTEELTVYDVTSTPTQTSYYPAPPTSITLSSSAATALITLDGVVHPRIEVQWDTPLDVLVTQIQVQYAAVSNATLWIDAGLVDVANNLAYISGVVAGQQYSVRIRSLRPSGAASAWEEIDGYTVSMTLSVVGILALDPGSLVADAFSDGTAEIIVSGFTAVIGNASVAVLPNGSVTLTGLGQQTLYWVYYVDPNFSGGAITPIATINSADFLNKPGFFLIDSITTPYAASSGSTSGRYQPGSYSDTGTRTTQNPTYAYDGNTSTAAVVGGSTVYTPGTETGSNAEAQPVEGPGSGGTTRITYGNCVCEGFSSVVTSTTTTLSVIASFTGSFGATGSIVGTVGSTSTTMFSSSATTASATYTVSIPSGTNINAITVQGEVVPAAGQTSNSGSLSVYEIYLQ